MEKEEMYKLSYEEVIKKVKELNGKELGHYVDKLLNESNLSEVARAVGIHYRTLQAWKRGENKWWTDTQEKLNKVKDTTGAGDAFCAGVVAFDFNDVRCSLYSSKIIKALSRFSFNLSASITAIGNAG